MEQIRKVIVLVETSRGYGRSLLRGVAEYSKLYGPWTFYRSRAFFLELPPKKRREELSRLKRWGAHGIIMRENKDMDEILAMGLPTIVSTYVKERVPGAAEIYVDNVAVGRMAAEHLLERGFRNFAFCGFEGFFWSDERAKGFAERIREAGFSVIAYEAPDAPKRGLWDTEQSHLAAWLKGLPTPVGLMACIDERSQHVVEACREAGRRIPEEVAVVGGDNDELLCDLSNPPVSSVAVSGRRAGYDAAALLDRLIRGENVTDQRVVVRPTRVVTRQSTDVLAIGDPVVAAALHFIRQHSGGGIQVDDVVAETSLSRRGLQERFRRVLGRSIHGEILRGRVAQAALMLEMTSLPITRIAMDLGYSEAGNFSRSFRDEMGMSPRAYREMATTTREKQE